jgi:hypothetical protein
LTPECRVIQPFSYASGGGKLQNIKSVGIGQQAFRGQPGRFVFEIAG